jgi:hypothetical protein
MSEWRFIDNYPDRREKVWVADQRNVAPSLRRCFHNSVLGGHSECRDLADLYTTSFQMAHRGQ